MLDRILDGLLMKFPMKCIRMLHDLGFIWSLHRNLQICRSSLTDSKNSKKQTSAKAVKNCKRLQDKFIYTNAGMKIDHLATFH